MWTKDALQELIQTQLGDRRVILVGNREPYQHRYAGGRLECVPPASGMVSALEPILRASLDGLRPPDGANLFSS